MHKFICLLAACFLFLSCQNDGYIGDLFGKWQLRTIERDGVTNRCDTVFFSFQSQVFCSTLLTTSTSSTNEYGRFKSDNNVLNVDMYKVSSAVDSVKFQIYGPINTQEIDGETVFCTSESFDIISLNKKEMTLQSRVNCRILRFRKY